MAEIYHCVHKQEKRMASFGRGSLTLSAPARQDERQRETSLRTRMVLYRGLAYSTAWLLTFIFPATIVIREVLDKDSIYTIRVLNCIFHPLQGFFNFLVFMYPKVIFARQRHPDSSILGAFIIALKPNSNAEETMAERRRGRRQTANRAILNVE